MKHLALLAVVICLNLSLTGKLMAAATLTTLYTFTGVDGSAPQAGLALGTNGNFYGTTEFGRMGTNCIDGCGTAFEISSTGAFTSRHSFTNYDGDAPRAGLLQASDGNLYGTTSGGGVNGPGLAEGTVFRMTPSGVVTTLHTFHFSDGTGPEGTLIEGTDGNFYGTTSEGGTNGLGTVFQITTNGVVTTLHGVQQPAAGVIQAKDGNFYGVDQFGGTSTNCNGGQGCGAVFKVTPDGVMTLLHSFDGTDGQEPLGELVEGSDGNLYGTTSGSPLGALNCANGCGTVFIIR